MFTKSGIAGDDCKSLIVPNKLLPVLDILPNIPASWGSLAIICAISFAAWIPISVAPAKVIASSLVPELYAFSTTSGGLTKNCGTLFATASSPLDEIAKDLFNWLLIVFTGVDVFVTLSIKMGSPFH